MTKRAFDVFLSLLAIFFLIPVFVVSAIVIKIFSPGPVVYKQVRIGKRGRKFVLYKFRSMVDNSNHNKAALYYTRPDDPRVTTVGRFLRRSSIDELPQLFNVLKGEMSLVGPRPNLEIQKKEYSKAEWDKRNCVRPGITGLAQAVLRSSATAEQRKELDLEYVDRASIFFDAYIILLTIKQVFSKNGN